jgi:hypothetical protein
MSLIKHGKTEWELSRTLDDGSGMCEYITATAEGLEISDSTIPWSELDEAREAAYKEANVLGVSKSREDFEAQIRKLSAKAPLIFQKWPDGDYCQHEVQNMWKGWQLSLAIFALENMEGK